MSLPDIKNLVYYCTVLYSNPTTVNFVVATSAFRAKKVRQSQQSVDSLLDACLVCFEKCSVQFEVGTVKCTVWNVKCSVCIVQSAACSVLCLCSAQYTVHTLHTWHITLPCSVLFVQCTVHSAHMAHYTSIQCDVLCTAVHSTQYTVHTWHITLPVPSNCGCSGCPPLGQLFLATTQAFCTALQQCIATLQQCNTANI